MITITTKWFTGMLVATCLGAGTGVLVYHDTLAELYEFTFSEHYQPARCPPDEPCGPPPRPPEPPYEPPHEPPAHTVPAPGTIWLLAAGAALLACRRRG